jgi:hypothetical protein
VTSAVEVSVVIPCLNERATVAGCVQQAVSACRDAGLAAEVIVADNGSSDGSAALAAAVGARIVAVPGRGYGRALMAGIAAAQGRFIVMGDADGSYDFAETPRIVAKLREGYELVQGCRFPSGGGRIAAGAMPPLHRWFGNPLLSWLARVMFGTTLHDVYCGLRGFTRDFHDRANLRCTGMEFATEMIIKSTQLQARVAEVPITLHRDGRGDQRSHLRTFRDGWRTLRLFLLCSPRWLFLIPGGALMVLGLAGATLALAGVRIGPAVLDVHTLLVASTAFLIGVQTLMLGVFAQTFAVVEGLVPLHPLLGWFYRLFNLEKLLLASAGLALAGAGLIAAVWVTWRAGGYGPLAYPFTLRLVIPGVTLIALAAQAVFNGFMVSILGLDRK